MLQVVVLEGGRVVESGPPLVLLARPGGRFAELWAKQQQHASAGSEGLGNGGDH